MVKICHGGIMNLPLLLYPSPFPFSLRPSSFLSPFPLFSPPFLSPYYSSLSPHNPLLPLFSTLYPLPIIIMIPCDDIITVLLESTLFLTKYKIRDGHSKIRKLKMNPLVSNQSWVPYIVFNQKLCREGQWKLLKHCLNLKLFVLNGFWLYI